MKQFGFPKAEHLCLQRDIDRLFSAGSKAFSVYPVRVVYREFDYPGRGPRVQVLLSVAKRRLRHAVSRHRAKRQLREAYRLQKHVLLDALPADKGLHLAFLWLAEGDKRTERIAESVGKLLRLIVEKEYRA